jgi:hypothetical protein
MITSSYIIYRQMCSEGSSNRRVEASSVTRLRVTAVNVRSIRGHLLCKLSDLELKSFQKISSTRKVLPVSDSNTLCAFRGWAEILWKD